MSGDVHHAGMTGHINRLPLGKRRDFQDGNYSSTPMGEQTEERSPGFGMQQVRTQSPLRVRLFPPFGDRGIGGIHPHGDVQRASRSFRNPGMIRMGVRQKHRLEVIQSVTRGSNRLTEKSPVARNPGVDQNEPPLLFDQVEIRYPVGQLLDPGSDLGNHV